MNVDQMKTKFNKTILSIVTYKRDDNKVFVNDEEYERRILEVKNSKNNLETPGLIKTILDDRNLAKYDVTRINGKDCLTTGSENSNKLVYIRNEEIFHILHSVHLALGHGDLNLMYTEIKNQYANVTKEFIKVYLRHCTECQKKSSNPTRELVVKPILQCFFTSQAQIDVIDMQSQSFNEFRFIMSYQDHLTKFVHLRALKTTSAKEVASALLEIYLTFGAPTILHSDNGKEFVNSIITELHAVWDGIKIVHGKPLHTQSQCSRANKYVEEMVAAWLTQYETQDWPSALKFIQFQKNRALRFGLHKTPFEAMFGCLAKVGLKSWSIPQDKISNVNSEEDIVALLHDNEEDADALEETCVQQKKIMTARKRSGECSKQQAKKVRSSNQKFSEIDVGTTVHIPIPDVDRA